MITLSILTPAMPARMEQIQKLCTELQRQIGGQPVEHLVLLDNGRRSVGLKRDALLRAARGFYVTFVDDDDWIALDYVSSLLAAAKEFPDLITFCQHATVNAVEAIIEFGLGNPNEPFPTLNPQPSLSAIAPAAAETLNRVKRAPWHICAWRRNLAILSHFPDSSYGEDWAFAAPLCAMPGLKAAHVDKVLHYYRHSAATTLAPPPG